MNSSICRVFNSNRHALKKLYKSNISRISKKSILIKSDTSENVFEIKFTECLLARTFREADASDIGYARLCYGDYAMTKAFNPNLKMIREKTWMQGHDCCHFKWFMEK